MTVKPRVRQFVITLFVIRALQSVEACTYHAIEDPTLIKDYGGGLYPL
jgi:hypothetical protein